MSAHVLLNLLNKLGKRDKMCRMKSILSLFCNAFNKFNNAARSTNLRFYLSYDIYITLKITKIAIFYKLKWTPLTLLNL